MAVITERSNQNVGDVVRAFGCPRSRSELYPDLPEGCGRAVLRMGVGEDMAESLAYRSFYSEWRQALRKCLIAAVISGTSSGNHAFERMMHQAVACDCVARASPCSASIAGIVDFIGHVSVPDRGPAR